MRPIAGVVAFILAAWSAGLAQTWEIGGGAGYAAARELNFSGPAVSGKTGISNGVAAGAVFGHNMYRRLGGEARYTYRATDLKLRSGNQTVNMDGDSHAVHYDFMVHATPVRSQVRPFGAVGAGVKYFRGTGIERSYQPLSEAVVLTRTSEAKPLLSLGGGLKVALCEKAQLRFDFRDYASPLPEKVIAARRGVSLGGWLHDFVFLVGISLTVE